MQPLSETGNEKGYEINEEVNFTDSSGMPPR